MDIKPENFQKFRKPKALWVRVSLLFILISMSFWAYNQFMINYRTITMSSEMVEALLLNKTELAGQYANELGLTREHLTQTGIFLDQLSDENEKLREKITLLDKVSKLENMIWKLKEKNAIIAGEMTELENKYDESAAALSSHNAGVSKELLSKYRQNLAKIRKKIRKLKRTMRQRRIAEQEALDKKESLLGNHGYFVRGGKSRIGSMNFPSKNLDIRVNVKFVE
jgi:hypothetical protein